MSIKITYTAEWLFTIMGDCARCKSVFVPVQCSEGTPVLSANVAQIKKVSAAVWYWVSFCLFWRKKKKDANTTILYSGTKHQADNLNLGEVPSFFIRKLFFFPSAGLLLTMTQRLQNTSKYELLGFPFWTKTKQGLRFWSKTAAP